MGQSLEFKPITENGSLFCGVDLCTAPNDDYLLFSVKSKQFSALASIVGRDEARIIQHMEYLFNQHKGKVEIEGRIFYHITAPKKYPSSKCLIRYMGVSESTLYRKLNNVRTQFRFQAGSQLDDSSIDFQGKYYFTAYENVDNRQNPHKISQVYWYRNAVELANLAQQIEGKLSIKAKSKATSAHMSKVCQFPGTVTGALTGTLAGQLNGEMTGDKYKQEHKNQITEELENNLESVNQEPNAKKLPLFNLNSVGETTKTAPHSAAPPSDIRCYHLWRNAVMSKLKQTDIEDYPNGSKIKLVKALEKRLKSAGVDPEMFFEEIIGKWGDARSYLECHHNHWTSKKYLYPILEIHFTGGLLSGLLNWYKLETKPKQASTTPFLVLSKPNQGKPVVQVLQQANQKPEPEKTSLGFTYWHSKQLKYHPSDGSHNDVVEDEYIKMSSWNVPWGDVTLTLKNFKCVDVAYSLNKIYKERVMLGYIGTTPPS